MGWDDKRLVNSEELEAVNANRSINQQYPRYFFLGFGTLCTALNRPISILARCLTTPLIAVLVSGVVFGDSLPRIVH